jgi:hypothetical protein
MSAGRVLVVGAGKRVLADVLPVLERQRELWEIGGVYARSAREVTAGDGSTHATRPLDELSAEDLAAARLVFLCVSKPAVPAVLRRLVALGASGTDILIDTPVVLFKHLARARLLLSFRNAWVAEDCSRLPWMDTVRAAAETGTLGELREVVCDRSAWHYHGYAMLKTLLGSDRVVSARRRAADGGTARIEVRLGNGRVGAIVEPRDYAAGGFRFVGSEGALADGRAAQPGDTPIEAVVSDGRCSGFRAGEVETALDADERALLGPMQAGETLSARMEDCKRVGLFRMFRDVAEGRGGYPLTEGLDDMAISWWLEKLGRFRGNALMSVKAPLGRALMNGASRLMGGG